jgi:hypothetical protein
MSANLLLFDDLGNTWDGGSPRLRDAFGSPATADEFSTYVVKNMGFIAVHGYGRSCEIRYRPRLVTPATFSALKEWTGGRAFDRIVTAHFDSDWIYGLHAGKEPALAKIDATLAASRLPRPGDYLIRPLAKDDLPRTTPLHNALHSLIENWPMLSQSVHSQGLWNIIHQSLQGRYHLIDANNGVRDLTFREIGSGFVSYADGWVTNAIGKAIEDQDDAPYGAWVAENYRQALKSGQPAVCDVDTITTTAKLGRTRLRYKRVLLPARSIGGGTWLLNSSILDPAIDLRADLLDKTA